ncbi:MAG: S8 family serine peptidase [Acidimicrobiales bacterium]
MPLAAAIAAVVGGGGLPFDATPPAHAGPSEAAGSASVVEDGTPAVDGVGRAAYEVTLITGDRVTVSPMGGGYGVTAQPAARPDGSTPVIEVTSAGDGDGVYAVPEDARPYIDAGRLDEELFNVEYLATHGHIAEGGEPLPVIVEYAEPYAADAADAAEALPSSTPTAVLESIDAVALSVEMGAADTFWAAIVGEPAGGVPERDAPLRAGIDRVWLDRTVRVALDESVPRIGAPEAWAAGFDGTGVTVAVIDTGIDATHPDADDKIVASRSFVPGEDVADGHGHGTHVASIAAGTGAASEGRYTGVAPGAELVIGKALSDAGTGPESQVIEAMEWAVLEQGADVVNLSLGSVPTDGSDPSSQAVNELTAATGALFVIAAGNTGPGSFTVSAPGAATAALTVGAVDDTDALAGFSSRGPRLGDHAIKPEITAPGVDITAARAAGTSMGTPVDEHYTTESGTSMATPHVAGAAAIVAQQHPDWDAEDLKAALVSTGVDGGYSVYEQGGGRVDVARAVRQPVETRPATADFAFLPWPQEGPPLTETLTYTNASDQDTTLELAATAASVDGTPVPDGVLTVEPAAVAVPAGGTATAVVTLDHTAVDAGLYTAGVEATGPDDTRLVTPVGFSIGEEMHTVGATVHERDGVDGFVIINVIIYAVDGSRAGQSESVNCLPGCPQPVEFSVPAGTYDLRVAVRWDDDNGQRHIALLLNPEFDVIDATGIELDANAAQPISIETEQPAEVLSAAPFTLFRSTADGAMRHISAYISGGLSWWVTPTDPVTAGEFSIASHWLLGPPTEADAVPPFVYQIKLYEDGRVPDSVHYEFADDELATVDNHFHADRRDTPFMLTWGTWKPWEFFIGLVNLRFAGPATLREYVYPLAADAVADRTLNTEPRTLWPVDNALDVYTEPNHRDVHWNTAPKPPGAVTLPDAAADSVIDYPFWVCAACRQGDTFYPFVHQISPGPHHITGRYGTPFGSEEIHLYRDGDEIPEAPPYIGAFVAYDLPPEPTQYRLTVDDQNSHTTWDFTSATVTDDETPPGYECFETFFAGASTPCRAEPLIFLRYDARVGLRNTVPAPSDRQFRVTAYRQAESSTVPRLAGLRLWMSTDDGAHWRRISVTPRGNGQYTSTVHYPRVDGTTGRVSLRVEAWDRAGNRVEQTIIGAYGLRARPRPANLAE